MDFVKAFIDDAATLARIHMVNPGERGYKLDAVFLIAALCAIPWDSLQLVSMIVGAFCYWVVQVGRRDLDTKTGLGDKAEGALAVGGRGSKRAEFSGVEAVGYPRTGDRKARLPKPAAEPMPGVISAKLETGFGWEADVAALACQLKAGPKDLQAAQAIVEYVQRSIRRKFPRAEVTSVALGSLTSSQTYGICVPDLDIVINISEDDLLDFVDPSGQGTLRAKRDTGELQLERLHKSALRWCAEDLTSRQCYRFLRSQFRGLEPKVTLLGQVAIDIAINAVQPHVAKALVDKCAEIEPRSLQLIQLVRRWARDQNLCFVPKGYPSPYMWTLFAVHFLQVRELGEGPLLPPLMARRTARGAEFARRREVLRQEKDPIRGQPPTPVGELIKEFFNFYGGSDHKWGEELVSIGAGKRVPLLETKHRPHLIVSEDQRESERAPVVEDPMQTHRSVRVPLNWDSLKRLRAELTRAAGLCADGVALSELFQSRQTSPSGTTEEY